MMKFSTEDLGDGIIKLYMSSGEGDVSFSMLLHVTEAVELREELARGIDAARKEGKRERKIYRPV